MCGGLSGALGLRARRLGASGTRAAGHALTYQIGRLLSYSLAGALGGSVIAIVQAFLDVEVLARVMRALAGLVLIGAAIGVLFKWRPLALFETWGARLWRHLSPLSRAIPANQLGGSLLIGPATERWDLAMLVRQASIEAFMAFAAHGPYLAGLGHLPFYEIGQCVSCMQTR